MGGRGGGMMQRSPIRGGTRGRGGGGGMRGAGGTRSYGMGRGYNRYDRKPQEVHIYRFCNFFSFRKFALITNYIRLLSW